MHKIFQLRTGLSVLVLAAIVGVTVLTIRTTQDLNNVTTVKAIVGKQFLLSNRDQPALATVTNSTELQSSFSVRIMDGDKVLIYQKTKQTIVYRPSIHKVVDVEPVNIGSTSSSNASATPSTAIPNINPFGNSN